MWIIQKHCKSQNCVVTNPNKRGDLFKNFMLAAIVNSKTQIEWFKKDLIIKKVKTLFCLKDSLATATFERT